MKRPSLNQLRAFLILGGISPLLSLLSFVSYLGAFHWFGPYDLEVVIASFGFAYFAIIYVRPIVEELEAQEQTPKYRDTADALYSRLRASKDRASRDLRTHRDQQSETDRALADLRSLAEQGSVKSQAYLGEVYAFGLGTSIDLQEAESWYLRAASLGNLLSQHLLGRFYLVNGRPNEACKVFEDAARKGYARSMYQLGRMHFAGLGVARDHQRGLRLMEEASERGNLPAKAVLANYERSGRKGWTRILPGVWALVLLFCETVKVLGREGPGSQRLRT